MLRIAGRSSSPFILSGIIVFACSDDRSSGDKSGEKSSAQALTTNDEKPVAPSVGESTAKPHEAVSPLSDEEKASLKAFFDSAPELEPVVFDHSNPDHDRIFRTIARHGGKTPENSPNFFKALDAAKAEHEKSGPKDPGRVVFPNLRLVGGKAMVANSNSARTVGPVQTLSSFGRDPQGSNYDYKASALSSVSGTPTFSYMSITITDEHGNPQGKTYQETQYLAGEEIVGSTRATLDPTDQAAKALVTFSWQEAGGTYHSGALHATTSNVPQSIDPGDPKDKTGDGMIKICWGRSGADCDYNPAGASTNNAVLPIDGSITYQGAIETPINSASGGNAFSSITISRPNPASGGGCHITSTTDFFQHITLSNSNKTISWNLDPAKFTDPTGCLTPNSFANYTFVLRLTVAGLPTTVAIASAPDTDPGPFTVKLPRTAVYFSCLAAGTRVSMADGREKLVEQVRAQDRFVTNRIGTVMTVESTLIGTEDIPMVRLVTERGHDLLLTQGHPVATASGFVLASELKVGDRVEAVDGLDELVSVSREVFDGHVYNFNIGTEADAVAITPDNTTFFANGILVGDNEMQFSSGLARQARGARVVSLESLSKEWRQDFLYERSRRQAN